MFNLIELYSIRCHLLVSKRSDMANCMILLVDYAHVKIYLATQGCITSNHSLQLCVHYVADIILSFSLFHAQLILLSLRLLFGGPTVMHTRNLRTNDVKKYLVFSFHQDCLKGGEKCPLWFFNI